MELDSKFMKKALFLISFAIILMWLLDNILIVIYLLKRLLDIISPFLLGLAIAVIFNGPMKFFEEKLPWKKASLGLRRGVSYLITLVLILTILYLISFIVIPELITTIQDLINKSSIYMGRIQNFLSKHLEGNEQLLRWAGFIDFDWEKFKADSIQFTKDTIIAALESTLNLSISIVNSAVTFALAFVFSIYVLFQKEKLSKQLKKLILAYLPRRAADWIFYIAGLSNRVFSNFLHGQIFEALILASLFFLAMTIFKFPYPLMISVTIGVTSIIPIFGAFIGLIIGAFLILVIDPRKALWFIVMFLIIQQLEGNLIYPHVVGKAAGLPSIWILVAVTLGGSLMGVLGILLFIPIFSILYTLLAEAVNNRLREKY